MRIEKGPGWEIRLGKWQTVLADVAECDAVITDPPYSERTHEGSDSVKGADGAERRDIGYAAWGDEEIAAFVEHWSERASGWMVALTSHDLVPDWERIFNAAGRLPFPPLPLVDVGSRVRIQGDGPCCWTTQVVVARPRTKAMAKWGTLPGFYLRPAGDERSPVMGGKPLACMRAIVRDYSRPGDLIVEPCAGGGTTLLAAAIEGRTAIGAEMDPDTFELAVKRLRKGYTPCLFGGAA